jgi:hypothetical protein
LTQISPSLKVLISHCPSGISSSFAIFSARGRFDLPENTFKLGMEGAGCETMVAFHYTEIR